MSAHDHPPIDTLARFAQGLLPPRELAAVAIHVARCQTCRTAATRPTMHPETGPATYGEAIHRVAGWAKNRAAQHKRDRRQAPGALDQILALPTEDWNRAIRSSPKYHSYAFAQHALKACKATWSDNPHRSERLAELALEVANRLPNKEHGRRNLNDLRANAWACIANCMRIRTDFLAMPDALSAGAEHLRTGTGNDWTRADLLRVTSSFLIETGHFDAATEVCTEGEELSVYLDDPVLQGMSLLNLGRALARNRRFEEAVLMDQRASMVLETSRQPRLTFIGKLNLAVHLASTNDPQKGLATLQSVGPAQHQSLSRLDRPRLAMAKAWVHTRLGDLQSATQFLEAARQGFEEEGIPLYAAEMSLRLAAIHLELGQTERVLRLAGETFTTFALSGLERETLEALDLLRQAGELA